MRKYISLALMLSLLIVGCTQTIDKITGRAVVCDGDYTLSGDSCCLDKNDNDVCDRDEVIEGEPKSVREVLELAAEEEVKESSEMEPVKVGPVRKFFQDLAEMILPKSEDFLEYYSPDYNIKIKYPKDWEILEPSDAVVEFVSPLEDLDTFSENLNIIVQDLPRQVSLDEYAELSLYQIGLLFGESQLDSLSDNMLAGYPAHRLIHSGKYGAYKLKWLQTYIIIDNKAYLITYTAEKDKYDDYLWIILEMIDSFGIG